MEILGVIPNIPVFEGDQIPVSRNALISDTRPLQFLPALGSDFQILHNTDAMRGFQSEWRHAGESCVTQLFSCEQLFDAFVQNCATSLYLNFDFDPFAHLDTLFAALECDAMYGRMSIGSILGVLRVILLLRLDGFPDIWFTAIILIPFQRIRTTRGATLMTGPWLIVLLQGYWVDRYYLGERVLEIRTATAQSRVPVAPPCHMCPLVGMTPEARLLEYGGFPADDYLVPGDYASYLSTRLKTRLPDVREYSQAEVGAPTGPTGVVLGDVPFPPGMEVTLDPTLGLVLTLAIPADLRQAPPQLQLDPEHATHVPAQRYQELYQRFCFAQTYIARLYLERHKMELEIDRLRRHQTRQAAAVSRLQMENDRLRTRLEVEGIPLDFSDEEEGDDDDSSSDDAPPLPLSSVR
ncbi:hypothetical protein JCGZ_13633 [Jatropha curcas]|uniref:Aminotransferase-like plant mobile domain-containing protein n=1 Tax=Jatropha curcas TaxID=180498 RepID=A0A067KA89_JATCU|nr:hypothetical protein JCGZ_13633 [Jatropha curcas]